jgi:hypothetical protein
MDAELRDKIKNQMVVNLDMIRQLANQARDAGASDDKNAHLIAIDNTVRLFKEIGISIPTLS